MMISSWKPAVTPAGYLNHIWHNDFPVFPHPLLCVVSWGQYPSSNLMQILQADHCPAKVTLIVPDDWSSSSSYPRSSSSSYVTESFSFPPSFCWLLSFLACCVPSPTTMTWVPHQMKTDLSRTSRSSRHRHSSCWIITVFFFRLAVPGVHCVIFGM